jgi:hypothetical protein
MVTVEMQDSGGLSEEEIKKLHALLRSKVLFERMVERAVRGMRTSGRRVRRRTSKTT